MVEKAFELGDTRVDQILVPRPDIIAIAEMSNGDLYMAKSEIKVTIGGCGG